MWWLPSRERYVVTQQSEKLCYGRGNVVADNEIGVFVGFALVFCSTYFADHRNVCDTFKFLFVCKYGEQLALNKDNYTRNGETDDKCCRENHHFAGRYRETAADWVFDKTGGVCRKRLLEGNFFAALKEEGVDVDLYLLLAEDFLQTLVYRGS